MEEPAGIIILKSLKDRTPVVQKNPGASLMDLGDGVVCCEFHSKMNSIGGDLVAMMHAGVKRLASEFDAMVIANQAPNFSVGANLMLMLISAQEGEWDDIHLAVRQFQRVNMAIKYAPRPVVAAPQGMALGGGCEISLHAARIHAAAEAYMGLVETGVGLIPGGGGTKEMLIRASEHAAGGEDLDLFHALKPVFENVAMAKVSTSAEEARTLGYLRPSDLISMNRDRQMADAKADRAGDGPRGISCCRRPRRSECWAKSFWLRQNLPFTCWFGANSPPNMMGWWRASWRGFWPEATLRRRKASRKQYVLDLEREAFVSLCGERKTQERIAHTLKTGKPLRN